MAADAAVVVDIPASWLADRPTLPDRCVKHGLPAATRVDFVVRSKPDIGRRRKLLRPDHNAPDRLAEYADKVTYVRLAGWPLCERCLRQRRLSLATASLLFFGGLAALIAAFLIGALVDGDQPILIVPILAGFAAMLASPWALQPGSMPRLTQTRATDDASVVQVADPNPAFTAQLPQPA